MASQRSGAIGDRRPKAATRATAMASREPKKVTSTVTQAPSSVRGRSSFMDFSDWPEAGQVKTCGRSRRVRPPASAPRERRWAWVKTRCSGGRKSRWVQGCSGALRPRVQPFRSGGAEFLGRLVGDIGAVEAERLNGLQMLLTAQPLLQL